MTAAGDIVTCALRLGASNALTSVSTLCKRVELAAVRVLLLLPHYVVLGI
jgi:hypothetical protein